MYHLITIESLITDDMSIFLVWLVHLGWVVTWEGIHGGLIVKSTNNSIQGLGRLSSGKFFIEFDEVHIHPLLFVCPFLLSPNWLAILGSAPCRWIKLVKACRPFWLLLIPLRDEIPMFFVALAWRWDWCLTHAPWLLGQYYACLSRTRQTNPNSFLNIQVVYPLILRGLRIQPKFSPLLGFHLYRAPLGHYSIVPSEGWGGCITPVDQPTPLPRAKWEISSLNSKSIRMTLMW